MTTSQVDAPSPRPDVGHGRAARRQWARWACPAAACWSLLYGVLGLLWALDGAAFPFGGPTDDTALATVRAAVAGPAVAAVGLAGATLALVMTRGRGRGGVRRALIVFGAILAVTSAVLIPGHRPLMAIARTPLVLVGAPFGWPPGLSLGEFFATMYPWPVLNELLMILGGLLWAAATLAYARRSGDACVHCGRTDHAATWAADAARWGPWAVAVAVAVPVVYALTRWAWALGIPLGFTREALRAEAAESPGIWVAGAGLATLAVGGALLTLGLVQRWGERFPGWVPFLRGRPVPARLAVVPATIVAALVTSAGTAYVRRALLSEEFTLDWGTGPSLLWPLWGIALGAATLAYHLRRRGACPDCHRS